MAFEYTPEINADYLTQLRQPILDRGTQQVGQARGEALRRGLTGDPFESLRVGAAQNSMNQGLAGAEAGLAYNTAGLRREERLIGEKNTYESAEAEKQRKFQAQMAETQGNYQWMLQKMQNDASRGAANAQGWGTAVGAAGTAAILL